MDINQYQSVAQHLLQKHYGLDINDTRLCEPAHVQRLIDDGVRPFESINEHADECHLGRTDISAYYGVPSLAPLSAADEERAMAPES